MPEASSRARLPLRLAHLTTVDMSLALLLGTELAVDVEQGHTVFGISASGPYVGRVEALGVSHVPVPSLTMCRVFDPMPLVKIAMAPTPPR